MELRRALADEASLLWAIRRSAIDVGCRGLYPNAVIDAWLSVPEPASFASRIRERVFFVAVDNARIVGFSGVDPTDAALEAVFVDPQHGGRGIGHSLVAAAEAAARQLALHRLHLKASLNAVAFYRREGYGNEQAGLHTSAEGLQIACVHMEKTLD